MKSKAKPAKGSARTKRFDVGGTVGALAGLGTLAYLMSRKKKGAATGNEGSGGSTAKPVIKSMMDTEDSAAKQRALQQSKDPKSLLVPEGADKDTLYESDKALVRTGDGGGKKRRQGGGASTSTTTNASTKATAAKDKTPATSTNASTRTDDVIGSGIRNARIGEKSKPFPSNSPAVKAAEQQKFLRSKAGLSGKGITTPGDAKKTEPTSKAGVVFGGSTVRSDKDKMADRAREVQRRREEEMKSRYKKGGAVKKYAAGGSVKASGMGSVKTAKPSMGSASKRADGIAQRGKTRGKVC
jgi:hypothetical protein